MLNSNLPTISFKDQSSFQERITHEAYNVAKNRFEGERFREPKGEINVPSRFNVTFFNGRKYDSHDMFAKDAATMRRYREQVGEDKIPLPDARERALTARLAKRVQEHPMHRSLTRTDSLPTRLPERDRDSKFAQACAMYDMPVPKRTLASQKSGTSLPLQGTHCVTPPRGRLPLATPSPILRDGPRSAFASPSPNSRASVSPSPHLGYGNGHGQISPIQPQRKKKPPLRPLNSEAGSERGDCEEVTSAGDLQVRVPVTMGRTSPFASPTHERYDTITRHTNTKLANTNLAFKVAKSQNEMREPFQNSPKLYETRNNRVTMPDGRRFNTYFRKRDNLQQLGDGSRMPILHNDELHFKKELQNKYNPKFYGHAIDSCQSTEQENLKNSRAFDSSFKKRNHNSHNHRRAPLDHGLLSSKQEDVNDVKSLNDWHKQTFRRLQSNAL